MTFNLRVRTVLDGPNIWEKRREMVVQRVRNFNPDLLGTQEGWEKMQTYLRGELTDYSFYGVGRGDGLTRGEMCGLFYKTARFERLDAGTFWLSPRPDEPGSHGWGEINPRIVTWIKLRPRDGSPAFCWFNTHFDAWSVPARAKSALLLRERMAQIAGAAPCLVTGDFNTGPGSAPYRMLVSAPIALADTFRAAFPKRSRGEGTYHFFSGLRGGRRMDWILASSHYQVIDASIDRTRGSTGYPSDHFPATATVRVR